MPAITKLADSVRVAITSRGVETSVKYDIEYSGTSGATAGDVYSLIGASGGLPARGTNHPDSSLSGAIVDDVSIDAADNAYDWTATVKYLRAFDPGQQPDPDDLTTKPPVIKTTFVPYEVPLDIVNSANEAFDPPVVDYRYNLLIDVDKYYSKTGMTPTIAAQHINTVNSVETTVGGYGITSGFGLIRAVDLQQNTGGNNNVYTHAHIQIEVSTELSGWKKLTRDRGLNQVVGGKLVPCVDSNGRPVIDPVDLNGSGVQNAISGAAKYIVTDAKVLKNWSGLSLPAGW